MYTHGFGQRRAAWMRRLAVSLTVALSVTPFAGLAPAAQAQGTLPSSLPVKSLLLFPASADTGAGDGAADLAAPLDAAIKLRLDLVGNYSLLTYTKFLPPVRRGLIESDSGGLTDADVAGPFDQARGLKIAGLVGTDAFLLTRILNYSQDPTTRRVTLVVSSRAYYSDTGLPVPGLSATVNGVAAPASASDSDADVQQGAVNDAAARITSALNAAAPQTHVAVARTHTSNGRGARTLLALGIFGALLYGIISGSHFGGGGGSSSSGGGSSSGGSTISVPAPPAVP
jgi:hypothetical protein